ncbi:MAG: hypothetical protein H0W25_07935, partial [Acidimicrobiia bacterium]|nr:hypothetical protein [Acidimicrobiia bacterium]
MIVCRKCGFHNQDADAFCGSCGSFLEFTGEKVVPPKVELPTEEELEETKKPKKGLLQRITEVAYLDVGRKDAMPETPKPGMPGGGPPGAGPPGGPPRPGGPPGAPGGP